jgi:hypothetical protein
LPHRRPEQHRCRRAVAFVVAGERSTERGIHAEQVEEVRRYQADAQLLGIAVAGESGGIRPDGPEVLETSGTIAQIDQLRRRERRARVAGPGHVGPDEHQAR